MGPGNPAGVLAQDSRDGKRQDRREPFGSLGTREPRGLVAGQHRPTSQADARTSAKKERNTARPAPSVCRTTTEMSDQPAGEPTTRRSSRSSARSPSGQDLRWWAAALAAALPPLTEPQVAAVARLAAHLDADHSQKPAA
jgi:hypothetical protein